MKVNVKIKNLPKEFDFKSNVNPLGLTYHAMEMDNEYVITSDSNIYGSNVYNYEKQRFHNCFLRKEFEVCN